ncbi:polycomb group RING finger protein 1 [Mustelus asterias]
MAVDAPMANAMRLRNQLQTVYKLDPLRNEEEVKVKIKDLNEHIVCYLCAGYFIDATTITECLHTFNLKLDRVMQDIVYKLVPGLQESEEKRIREFYQSRGLDRIIQPVNEAVTPDLTSSPYTTFDHSKAHYYRYDEQVSLCLERHGSSLGKEKGKLVLQQKYVRCSVRAEIRHLRRVLCHRINVLDQQQVQILFDNEPLPEHMTMKQLWLLRWYGKPTPMILQYSVKEKRGR